MKEKKQANNLYRLKHDIKFDSDKKISYVVIRNSRVIFSSHNHVTYTPPPPNHHHHQTAKYKTLIHVHVNIKKNFYDQLKFDWSIHKADNSLIYVNKVCALFLHTQKILSIKFLAKTSDVTIT